MRSTWRLLTAQRDLRFLLGAGLVSMTGDWILRIGLVYYVYVLTSSTMASALVMLSSFAPQIIFGSLAGAFVDRWDRKRTMVVSNLLLAAGLVPLVLVTDTGRVWIAYLVLAFESTVAQFFAPAEQALIPHLVPDDQLVSANAAAGQVRDSSRLIGSAIGGVAAAAGGLTAVTLVDAGSFVVAAALLTLVRAAGRTDATAPVGTPLADAPAASRIAVLRTEWADGIRVALVSRVLRTLTVFIVVTSLGEGIMATLFAPFVRTVLHGTNQAYGVIVASQAIGGIVGGMAAVALGQKFPAERLLWTGAVLFGLVDLAIFLYPLGFVAAWPAAVGMVVVGLPGAVLVAGLMALFQRNTSDSHRGRVFGALSAIEGVAVLIGTLGAGWLGTAIGIIPILAIQGGGYVVAGVLMLASLRRTPAVEVAAEPEVALAA